MSPVISGPMMDVRGSAPRFWCWRLPVHQSLLDIHTELCHLFEPLGGDEILSMAFGLLFLDPLKFLGGLDKGTADGEGIDWSQTVIVFTLGFHLAPLAGGGMNFALYFVRSGNLEKIARAG